MPGPDKPLDTPDPRTYFAAERTLLAWIRTGLAMMGFGFVVARFGLFLREIAAVDGSHPARSLGFSLWTGTALIVMGVLVNVCAAAKHYQTVNLIAAGKPVPLRPLSLAGVTALLLAVIGVFMAVYLMLTG